jgi:Mg-chelatase subunit ChlD
MKLILSIASIALALALGAGCQKEDVVDVAADVQRQVVPPTSRPAVDGIGLAVVVDCSGSMGDRVSDGVKSDLAKKCTRMIVQRAEQFAKSKNTPVSMAIYRFSDTPTRVWPTAAPTAVPSLAGAESAIASMEPGGGTAIGDAVIAATRDLNQTGYSSVNVIVVTDGENTQGTSPDAVSSAFAKLPTAYRPKVFIAAFDVNATVFNGVKANDWRVLSASNGAELNNTLDALVGGEILLEK